VERQIRLARFPQTKSFDTFDFAAQPSLNKALVRELKRATSAACAHYKSISTRSNC
jgi:DNA replication protein DnaC